MCVAVLKRTIVVLLCSIGCVTMPTLAQEDHRATKSDLPGAEELFNRVQYETSLSRLDMHATDPASLFLIGRDYYMLADFKKAAGYLKKAVAAAPGNSEYVDWLGRAYDKQAQVSNPLHAVTLEVKARRAFERAVQLNARNREALSDLFDCYLEMPAVLGGGYGKAESVAEKMWSVDVSLALLERAELAGKRQPQNDAREQMARLPVNGSALFKSAAQ